MFLFAVIGAVLSLPLVLAFRRGGVERERLAWAVALVVAALIYVGFALVGGAGVPAIAIESVGVALFAALALFACRRGAAMVGLGWLLHVIWDVALHPVATTPFVPAAYPALCVGFDVTVGIYLLAPAGGRWKDGSARRST